MTEKSNTQKTFEAMTNACGQAYVLGATDNYEMNDPREGVEIWGLVDTGDLEQNAIPEMLKRAYEAGRRCLYGSEAGFQKSLAHRKWHRENP